MTLKTWCERCWDSHFPGEHLDTKASRRRSPSGRGASVSSRRGPGEWLGDALEGVAEFFFGWLK